MRCSALAFLLVSSMSLQLNNAVVVAVSVDTGGRPDAALSGSSRLLQEPTVSVGIATVGTTTLQAPAVISTSALLGSNEASTYTAPPSSQSSAWITIVSVTGGLGVIATVIFQCWRNGYILKFVRREQARREDEHA
ncbi:hypothetical protein FRB95_003955 [Tulasnella sp. JGI-2019a]|nr:hypothetical protein FRB95_003955 [Tulasnella sp. JGI-2019a]